MCVRITAPTLVELLAAVYDHHGWKRVAGESRSKRVNELYKVTIKGNRFVATPKVDE